MLTSGVEVVRCEHPLSRGEDVAAWGGPVGTTENMFSVRRFSEVHLGGS